MIDKNGKPLNGTPLHRLQAVLADANSPVVSPLAGDLMDLCVFLGDDKFAAGVLDQVGRKIVAAEGRVGIAFPMKGADLARLVKLATDPTPPPAAAAPPAA